VFPAAIVAPAGKAAEALSDEGPEKVMMLLVLKRGCPRFLVVEKAVRGDKTP